jgi:peptidyl-prolyl cis-trans isomerase D
MLQEMRKYTKSWAANVLLGLLTLSFVSWGAGSWMNWGVDTSIAKVGGTPIDQNEFRRDYSNIMKNLGAERRKPLSAEEARKMNLGKMVLEQDIDRVALANVTHDLGMTISDSLVMAEIQRIPGFANQITGQFDRNTFRQAIERAGYSEQGFIEVLRGDIIRTQLSEAVQGGYLLPAGYARALFSFATEMRAAEYIVVDAKSLGPIPAPSDAELQAYVKAHPNRYSTPEYRDVTYGWITPDDVANGITVTDDQIKQAYENHIDQFVIPEKRGLQQLQFKTEAEAKAAYAKLKAGSKFEQVAPADEKPIVLPDLVEADLEKEQGKAVFALKKDEVSAPLKSNSGWVLMKVTGITPGTNKTLDQAKDELRKAIAQELALSKLTDISNAYTDAASGGLSLSDAAKKVGMHVARISAIDINGYAPDGSKTSAPDDPDFRKLVFRAEPGEEGDPQVLKSGTYVIGVNGATPPKLKPLDQVRTLAVADWTNEQRAKLLRQKAQELTAMANRDRNIDGAAKTIGASVQESPALGHRSNDDVFSQSLVAALFQASPGQAVFGQKGKSGDWIVARLTGIFHPPLPENDMMYKASVEQISRDASTGITESFTASARGKQGVTYNDKNLQTVVGSETGEGS